MLMVVYSLYVAQFHLGLVDQVLQCLFDGCNFVSQVVSQSLCILDQGGEKNFSLCSDRFL
ncbi:hypothetical protein [Azonexus hydrophilus]|uniref:hypothetical protein n=1 Tax=Azonexus hydrophilus TaxID=418702 RepID=UPI003CCBA6D3